MRLYSKQAGVTIIEVLIALFILAAGLVALLKFQSNLLQNRGLVSQRSEAVSLAENKLEDLRHYVTINTTAGVKAYDDIAGGSSSFSGTSTSYTLTWTVAESTDPPYKAITITVTWTDAAGGSQSVTLDTIVGKVDPAMSGTIMQGL